MSKRLPEGGTFTALTQEQWAVQRDCCPAVSIMYLRVWEGSGGGGSTDWKQTRSMKNQHTVTKLLQKSWQN